LEERFGTESLRAARFLETAEAKMRSLKTAPKGASFRLKLAKKACKLARNRRFSGLLFTNEYMGAVDRAVYFVSLTLITTPQEAGF